jgi:hypothetical protein
MKISHGLFSATVILFIGFALLFRFTAGRFGKLLELMTALVWAEFYGNQIMDRNLHLTSNN